MFKSLGSFLRGDSSNGGTRHVTSKGASYTSGPAKDKSASGGSYFSVTSSSGEKRSQTFGSSGNKVKDSGWRSKK